MGRELKRHLPDPNDPYYDRIEIVVKPRDRLLIGHIQSGEITGVSMEASKLNRTIDSISSSASIDVVEVAQILEEVACKHGGHAYSHDQMAKRAYADAVSSLPKEMVSSRGVVLRRSPVTKSTHPRKSPCPCGSGKKFKHCCME
jgi:hypothetical protein